MMTSGRINQLKDESLSICEAGAGEWLREALEEVELLQAQLHRWIKAGATCAEDRHLLEVENERLTKQNAMLFIEQAHEESVRSDMKTELTSALNEIERLSSGNKRLQAEVERLRCVVMKEHKETCIHHNDKEREDAGCPVCVKAENASLKVELKKRLQAEKDDLARELAACAVALPKHFFRGLRLAGRVKMMVEHWRGQFTVNSKLEDANARLRAALSEIIHKETQFNGGVIVSDEERVRLWAIVEKGTE